MNTNPLFKLNKLHWGPVTTTKIKVTMHTHFVTMKEISLVETMSPGCNVFAVGTDEPKITRYLMKAFMEIVTLIYTAVEIRKRSCEMGKLFHRIGIEFYIINCTSIFIKIISQ